MKGWHPIIGKLIEWGRDPRQLDDEDVTSPSVASLNQAYLLAICGGLSNISFPQRAVSNDDGGIVFEYWDGPNFETIEIFEDGSVELCCFYDGKLFGRFAQRNNYD